MAPAPRWNDLSMKRGTMVRVALWLLQEVGVGNVFTKADLRDAFPGVEQVDRRMRDLRVRGWRIATNIDDASLTPNELRFATAGENVWEAGKARVPDALSSKSRKMIMDRDGYLCVTCGVGGGEAYPDSKYETAQLGVTTRPVKVNGKVQMSYYTECNRCRSGGHSDGAVDVDTALRAIDQLDDHERNVLNSWVRLRRRSPTKADQIWMIYRRLGDAGQAAVRRYLNA